MRSTKKQSLLWRFLKSDKEYPVLAAIGAGLYPLLFYYTYNFTLIDSWAHLGYFLCLFLLLPIVIFKIMNWVSKRPFANRWGKYVLPFLNVFVFLIFLKIILYSGIHKKIIVGILFISAVVAFFLYKHLKKWMVIQFILAAIGIFTVIPVIVKNLSYSDAWMQQPDDIAQVVFKKKPNIYYIQPDGYVNFSVLKGGFYHYDNSEFEIFLDKNGFKNYPGFRSNYTSTLSTNSANFMMKHHYYNGGRDLSEALQARKVIISKNTVLDIFKNNGYKTHYIAQHAYLLANRPKIGYDVTNFTYKEIPFITTGLEVKKDVVADLKKYLQLDKNSNNFFFVEFLNPGHINNQKSNSLGKEGEREAWLERLQLANQTLEQLITTIKEKDPNGLIVIMADHGGYVGMDYAQQTYVKTQNEDLINTTFSAILSIHWPKETAPEIDVNLKSGINMFRILFSYLSEDNKYLENLEDDSSWVMLKEGVEPGIYQYIDKNGNITCKKR